MGDAKYMGQSVDGQVIEFAYRLEDVPVQVVMRARAELSSFNGWNSWTVNSGEVTFNHEIGHDDRLVSIQWNPHSVPVKPHTRTEVLIFVQEPAPPIPRFFGWLRDLLE